MNEETKQAKFRLDEAEIGLVRAYFHEIESKYSLLNPIQRRGLLIRLEGIAQGLITPPLEEADLFDGRAARDVRQKAGINLTELANQLGINKSTLSRLENGHYKFRSKDGFTGKYLEFLKQNGYDPFTPKAEEVSR